MKNSILSHCQKTQKSFPSNRKECKNHCVNLCFFQSQGLISNFRSFTSVFHLTYYFPFYFLHIHFLFSSFPSPLPLSALPTMIGCRRNKAYVFIAYIAPESFFVQLLSEFWNWIFRPVSKCFNDSCFHTTVTVEIYSFIDTCFALFNASSQWT